MGLTNTEINEPYANETTPAILSFVTGSSDRTTDGLLTTAAISDIINRLKRAKIIPTLPVFSGTADNTMAVNTYNIDIGAFITKGQVEYNEHAATYRQLLQQLFTSITNGYRTPTSATASTVESQKENVLRINNKLNDLIQIIKAATDEIKSSSDVMQTQIYDFNEKAKDIKTQLRNQSSLIKSNQTDSKINKEMMKYTEEKGRYTDNLLKMYSFLNVVAFGLLIYIYRAA